MNNKYKNRKDVVIIKAYTIMSDYPDKIDQITFKTEDDKTEIILKVDTVLIDAVATKVLNMELINNKGEVAETVTTIQLKADDLTDLMMGIKTLNTILTQA